MCILAGGPTGIEEATSAACANDRHVVVFTLDVIDGRSDTIVVVRHDSGCAPYLDITGANVFMGFGEEPGEPSSGTTVWSTDGGTAGAMLASSGPPIELPVTGAAIDWPPGHACRP